MVDLERIKIGLQLLDDKERQEAEKASETDQEPQITIWERVKLSKHFDFIIKIGLTLSLIGVIHVAYLLLSLMGGFFPAIALEAMLMALVTGAIMVIGSIIIDLMIYSSERIYYNFIKRNGNHNFDYQELLSQLTAWQKTLITTIKVLGYLFVYSLLYRG